MKKSIRTVTAQTSSAACFVPIQSFDLAAQDPLLDLFAGTAIETTMKHEVTSIELHHHHHHHSPNSPSHRHNHHHNRSHSPSQSYTSHHDHHHQPATTHTSDPLDFLSTTLPVPPQLDPPAKRRKRRASSIPKHVQDLAKLQEELSSSETSDSERGGSVKLQLRKLKNRASAAKSRLKAQARQEQLEKDVVELHRQNAYLRELVISMAQATGHPLPALPHLANGVAFDIAL